ncbi:hypothetical protein ALP75_201979 [Pseudomonas syringae pv. actinidiae]|nr:hypothetical protein ALP75_201979 [Pseudomonas syringae pv. actinidiae]
MTVSKFSLVELHLNLCITFNCDIAIDLYPQTLALPQFVAVIQRDYQLVLKCLK